MDADVSSFQKTVNKYFQKPFTRGKSKWRNNLRFEGVREDSNEKWEDTEEKIKSMLVKKLDLNPAPEIDRAHRTGRPSWSRQDGTSKPETVLCKFTSYKAKEAILRKPRMIKPEGLVAWKIWLKRLISQLPQPWSKPSSKERLLTSL